MRIRQGGNDGTYVDILRPGPLSRLVCYHHIHLGAKQKNSEHNGVEGSILTCLEFSNPQTHPGRNTLKIRQADPSDLEGLLSLVAGFREVLGRSDPDDENLMVSLKKLLASDDAEFFLVVDEASTFLGYIQQRYRHSIWLSGLEATLEDLYVSPYSRKQGIATRLVKFAIGRAKEKGCKAIKLDTNESNHAAINLYGKLGFSSGSSRFSNSRQLLFEKRLEGSF